MEPKLYIIMRKDIQDMNPGKAMAQAAHAQSDFEAYVSSINNLAVLNAVTRWREDRSFGVTLVLHETLETINLLTNTLRVSGATVDPTYPWRNFYNEVFVSSEVTCAWAFVYQEDESDFMRNFNLHK